MLTSALCLEKKLFLQDLFYHAMSLGTNSFVLECSIQEQPYSQGITNEK